MAATVVRNVFVYGSLLAPEVLAVLLHRVPRSSPAVVHDYHRYSIKNRIYPAVLLNKGDRVYGKVLFDLSEQELCILDKFEDVEYTKLIVSPLILEWEYEPWFWLVHSIIALTLQQKAEDNDGKVVDSAPNIEVQGTTDANTLEEVSNGLPLPNDLTENVALGNNSIEIPPGHLPGLSSTTEVAAYMYVWANQGDPDLFGDWDYELWRTNHLRTFLKTDSGFSGGRSGPVA